MDCHYNLANTTNRMVALDFCTVLYINTYLQHISNAEFIVVSLQSKLFGIILFCFFFRLLLGDEKTRLILK